MAQLKLALKNFLTSITTYAFCFTCLNISVVYFLFVNPSTLSSIMQKPPEHTLCVLVPFREVFEELQEFIPFMNAFLNRQSIKFHIVVVNHVADGNRFNRGVLFNAGFDIVSKNYTDCDYIALHDVDLLPLNDDISYAYPGDDIHHVAHPHLHPVARYDLEKYMGGIVIISNKQYLRMNGFGNYFWGWGDEDGNFYRRMKRISINRVRPSNLTTDRNNTFKDIHSPYRIRDMRTCGDQGEGSFTLLTTDFESGLSDLKYMLTSVHSIIIDEIPFTVFGISIPCDYSKTPWCELFCT